MAYIIVGLPGILVSSKRQNSTFKEVRHNSSLFKCGLHTATSFQKVQVEKQIKRVTLE